MKKSSILFLHPSAHPQRPMFITMPMGMISMMNRVKHICNVRAINVGLEMSINREYQISDELKNIDFNIAAIDLHWHEHSFTSIELAKLCKEIKPDCTVIIGGLTASIFARDILSKFGCIDAVITGDGEVPLNELAKLLQTPESKKYFSSIPNLVYRDDGRIKQNPAIYIATEKDDENYIDISSLKHWEEYLKSNINFYSKNQFWYNYWLCIAKGCRFNCAFCGGGEQVHKKIFRRPSIYFRPVYQIVRDVMSLSLLGIHTVNFSCDPQMAGIRYWQTLFRRIREEGIKIGAYIEINNLMGRKFIDDFAHTFISEFSTIVLTPLSGNEKIRMKNGKKFTNTALLSKIELLEDLGIPYVLYFATGLPFESEVSFEETLNLVEKISSNSHLKMIFSTPLTIDPCSPIFNNPQKYGVFTHLKNFNDYYNRCKKRANNESFDLFGYHTDRLSTQKMMELQDRWNKFIRGKLDGIIANSTMCNLNFL